MAGEKLTEAQGVDISSVDARNIYRAMIEAAPPAPGGAPSCGSEDATALRARINILEMALRQADDLLDMDGWDALHSETRALIRGLLPPAPGDEKGKGGENSASLTGFHPSCGRCVKCGAPIFSDEPVEGQPCLDCIWPDDETEEEASDAQLWSVLVDLALEKLGFRFPGESDFDLIQRAIIESAPKAADLAKLRRIEEEVTRLHTEKRTGDAACRIVAELVALIPLSETLKASKDGNALVAYFRSRLRVSDRSPEGAEMRSSSVEGESPARRETPNPLPPPAVEGQG